jgi:hypothetical protein
VPGILDPGIIQNLVIIVVYKTVPKTVEIDYKGDEQDY